MNKFTSAENLRHISFIPGAFGSSDANIVIPQREDSNHTTFYDS